MERIVELNRGPFVGAQAPLRPVDDVGDAVVLDVRPSHEFGAGHRRGAVNVPVSGASFATRSAFVLPDRRVVIHSGDEEEAFAAGRGLNAVGIFDLAGWQVGNGDERLETVTLDELERLLAAGESEVLDVREADERDSGFIPGTDHLPYRNLRQAAENGLCGARPIVTAAESRKMQPVLA